MLCLLEGFMKLNAFLLRKVKSSHVEGAAGTAEGHYPINNNSEENRDKMWTRIAV